jgi:hypothetical protein
MITNTDDIIQVIDVHEQNSTKKKNKANIKECQRVPEGTIERAKKREKESER